MTQNQPIGIVERIKSATTVEDVDFLFSLSSGYHEASAKTIRRVRRAGHARVAFLNSHKPSPKAKQ